MFLPLTTSEKEEGEGERVNSLLLALLVKSLDKTLIGPACFLTTNHYSLGNEMFSNIHVNSHL